MGKFNDKQIKDIIDTIIILVDSRERGLPNHITKAFDKYNINWEVKKLNSGDYSARIPVNEELGILEEINLEDILCIERKMSSDELSQNISKNRDRFHREFKRSKAKIILLIEEDTYEGIALEKYRSKLTAKQYLGALHGFTDEHDSPFIFISRKSSALYIYNVFKYRFRNIIKII